MSEAICDPENCPTGKDLKAVHKELKGVHVALKESSDEVRQTRETMIEQSVQLGHVMTTLVENKRSIDEDIATLYNKSNVADVAIAKRATLDDLKKVDDKVAKKLDLGTVAKASGMVTAIAGFLYIIIQFVVIGGTQ